MSKAEFFFIPLYSSFKQIQQKRRRNGRSTTKLSVEVALRQIKKSNSPELCLVSSLTAHSYLKITAYKYRLERF